MTKPPVPGQVKTRLIGPYSPTQAAQIHEAMLECVITRIEAHFDARLVIAIDLAQPEDWPARSPWQVVGQGDGDLGQRIAHVWDILGRGMAVFFGVDSPDVPIEHLKSILPALAEHDAAVGAVEDGGFWTLAATHLAPDLLRGIDWGTPSVYHQTLERARDSGLSLQPLGQWFDVDNAEDLSMLRQRIVESNEPALMQLGSRLNQIMEVQLS